MWDEKNHSKVVKKLNSSIKFFINHINHIRLKLIFRFKKKSHPSDSLTNKTNMCIIMFIIYVHLKKFFVEMPFLIRTPSGLLQETQVTFLRCEFDRSICMNCRQILNKIWNYFYALFSSVLLDF